MHVERIQGNVKGSVDTELGRLTLIVGPNGSGKSRIVNTLELALLGYASDVVGRAEVRKESELIALSSGDTLLAKAVLSDGRTCVWETEKTKTGTKRAQHVKAVSAQFPVTEIREALTGSVETARKWLLQRIAATVSRSDVTKYMPSDEALALFESKAKYASGSEVDVLLAVFESAKSEKRSKSAQQTATGKSISTLADGLAAEPTEAQLQAAQAAVDAAMAAYRSAVEANVVAKPAPADPEVLRPALVELAASIEQVAAYRAEMEQACAKGSPNDAVILALSDVVRFQRSSKLPACAVCDGAVSDGALASKESLLASVAADAQARKQAQAEAQRAADMEASMLAKLQAGIAAFQAAQAAWEAYQPVQTPTGGADAVNAAAMALRTANDAQAALNRTAGAWKSVRSLKQEEREAKKAIAALEELIEGCKAAVEGILKSATDTFIARVQSFLPATDVFALELNDGDREVCRFGFVRDGNLHTALSGAEWARLTLALACAASGEATDTLRVFVPEDRAFDPNTLRDVLVALANAPGQVIFATTTKPAGRLPKGWTLIETGLTD